MAKEKSNMVNTDLMYSATTGAVTAGLSPSSGQTETAISGGDFLSSLKPCNVPAR